MNTTTISEIVNEIATEVKNRKRAPENWGVLTPLDIRSLSPQDKGAFGEKIACCALKESGLEVSTDHTGSKDLLVNGEGCEVKTSFVQPAWFNQIKFGASIPATPWKRLVFVFVSPGHIEVWLAVCSNALKATLTANNHLSWRGTPAELSSSLWTKVGEWNEEAI